MTELDIQTLRNTIGLLSSMVDGGELHSDISRAGVSKSLEILNNLKPNESKTVNRNEQAREVCQHNYIAVGLLAGRMVEECSECEFLRWQTD